MCVQKLPLTQKINDPLEVTLHNQSMSPSRVWKSIKSCQSSFIAYRV